MIVWPNIAHALRLATKLTPCMTGQVHLLVYYIKLKSHLSVHLSVCLSTFFVFVSGRYLSRVSMD